MRRRHWQNISNLLPSALPCRPGRVLVGPAAPLCFSCPLAQLTSLFCPQSCFACPLDTLPPCQHVPSAASLLRVVSLSHIDTLQSRSSSLCFLLAAVSPPPLAQPPLERPLLFFLFFTFFLALPVAVVVVFLSARCSAGLLGVRFSHPPSVSLLSCPPSSILFSSSRLLLFFLYSSLSFSSSSHSLNLCSLFTFLI